MITMMFGLEILEAIDTHAIIQIWIRLDRKKIEKYFGHLAGMKWVSMMYRK